MKTPITLVSTPGGWPDDSPARSACFGLPPQGESGESYESLASYFRRLSAYHGLFPRVFANRAVGPLFHDQEVRTLDFARDTFTMNGAGARAAMWVNALEKLTMRSDLASGTLLPLRTHVSLEKLLSQRECFCPSCYSDDESVGRQKYNRLLWSIHCVEACPLHNTLLETVPERSKPKRYTFWLPGLSRIDGSSLANHETRKARKEQVRSAHLVAQLLDEIHQFPEAFSNCSRIGEFMQHAVNTLCDGSGRRLARYLGVYHGRVDSWLSGQRASLPILTIIANRCDCKISDILLGKNVKLRKKYASADGYNKVVQRHRRAPRFKTSDALVAALEGLDKLGLVSNLSQASRLLNTGYCSLRRLAPGFAALLVRRGQEARHREKLARDEKLFNEYWKCFQDVLSENARPTRERVEARLFQQSGIKPVFGFNKLHTKALALADLSSVRHNENVQEKPLRKNRVGSRTINSCRKRH
ncbi:hypothetical protein GCT19_31570 [Paraburkholderia sp. CNPSo 3155]|uniref:TniQ family protein n=1 Tax=Paraburkholderia atlantica TaxID=2654982 RepID=UPI00128BEDA4|nr:TniQ family protein [Paraburkholderia atlantica]MPW10125.1 hypothetical protein [Paraburkholderia atlantica]